MFILIESKRIATIQLGYNANIYITQWLLKYVYIDRKKIELMDSNLRYGHFCNGCENGQWAAQSPKALWVHNLALPISVPMLSNCQLYLCN